MIPIHGDAPREQLEDNPDIDIDEVSPLVNEGLLIEAATPGELEGRRDSLLTGNQAYFLRQGEQRCERLVVAITSSSVAALMATVILSLCHSGFQTKIDLILTKAAQRFAQRDLFEYYGIDARGSSFNRRNNVPGPHIALGDSADSIMVCRLRHRPAIGLLVALLLICCR